MTFMRAACCSVSSWATTQATPSQAATTKKVIALMFVGFFKSSFADAEHRRQPIKRDADARRQSKTRTRPRARPAGVARQRQRQECHALNSTSTPQSHASDCCCSNGTTLIEPLLAKDQLADRAAGAAADRRREVCDGNESAAAASCIKHEPVARSWSASAAVVARAPSGSCAATRSSIFKGARPPTPNQKSSATSSRSSSSSVLSVGVRRTASRSRKQSRSVDR